MARKNPKDLAVARKAAHARARQQFEERMAEDTPTPLPGLSALAPPGSTAGKVVASVRRGVDDVIQGANLIGTKVKEGYRKIKKFVES